MSSPATDDNDAEASRRPLGARDGDSRRPPGETPDHLGKSWGNQVIAHTAAEGGPSAVGPSRTVRPPAGVGKHAVGPGT